MFSKAGAATAGVGTGDASLNQSEELSRLGFVTFQAGLQTTLNRPNVPCARDWGLFVRKYGSGSRSATPALAIQPEVGTHLPSSRVLCVFGKQLHGQGVSDTEGVLGAG